MKKLVKIEEVITNYNPMDPSDPLNSFNMQGESHFNQNTHYPGQPNIITIITSNEFYNATQLKFNDRSFLCRENRTPIYELLLMWNDFVNKRSSYFADIVETITKHYNPIENYNMQEFGSDNVQHSEYPGITETETQTPLNWQKTESFSNFKETQTQTPDGWKTTETQTPDNWIKESTKDNSNNVVERSTSFHGFNSNEPVPVTGESTHEKLDFKEEQKGTYEVAQEQEGTYETTLEKEGSITETQSGTFSIQRSKSGSNTSNDYVSKQLTRTGNIGVTTTQQMIDQEIRLKLKSIKDIVLQEFFDEYTIYV